MIKSKSKAQSIVEYLLVFGAIVLAVIYGANQLGKSTKAQMNGTAGVVDKVNTTLGCMTGN